MAKAYYNILIEYWSWLMIDYLLEFPPDKYVSMSINSKGNNKLYKMKDVILNQVQKEKDIGVIIDSQLHSE